jgi:hypothetical protein
MKALVISYLGGMFGEFTASLIEQGSDTFISDKHTEITNHNRFLYPNYLSPINFECKTFPKHNSWTISADQVSSLHKLYGEKIICLPTHWYSKDINQTNLPCTGIVLYASSLLIVKLAYSLFWIKSHRTANTLWPSRMQEIKSMIDSNHPYSKELSMLQVEDNYQNWKFLSYKYNFLNDGQLDLHYYITQHFNSYKKDNFLMCAASPDWFKFDIGTAIHGNGKNISLIEQHLDISIDRQRVSEYSEKNLDIIKGILGLTVDNFYSEKWLDNLYEYCKLGILS